MITRSKHPPKCTDPFLDACATVFHRRGKSIRYLGALEFVYPVNEAREWFTAVWCFADYPTVKLQVLQGARLNLYLISVRVKDRGRVILRLEDIRALPNAEAIVRAFKETLLGGSQDDSPGHVERVRRKWDAVTISAVDP